ncbi:RNI-like protein [Lentinus tigrinus ALCF2SS1-7]|uniref:RNI-like protein n=1 Tax=Lentinus tigrinus ALCF2SS1-6 TaxID=1328759 RepID=A0A5C2SUW6_9APHY|nr:RNI-like protein [Lentinus tigrinus ALCF2SS1-6]RPD80795.1 RNI-like protein [Lentinus tigrinus ALCF2SS1-7]
MEHAYIDELPSDEESCYYAEHLVFHPDPDPTVPPAYTDDELAAVLPYCPHIAAAYLSGIPDLSSRTLILLAEHASGLTYLDISGCTQVTDLGLQAVAAHSTSLCSLFISRIPSITDHGLAALVRGLPHLEELEMENLPLVTALSARDIWTFARGLKRWILSGCMHITDSGFPWVPERTQLEAEDADKRRTWMESLPPLILPATHKLNNLRVLDLSHCLRLTDAAILGVVAHAPRIHNLNLAGCIELTDRALHAICTLGRHLRIIDVGGLERVTDEGVFAVASACGRLRSVDISFIPGLTDLAILEFASQPNLTRLAAAGLPKLTEQATFFLAEHAFELEQLHLSYCPRLTLVGIRTMLRRLTKLMNVGLSGVPAMRRMGIRRFSQEPPEGYKEGKQGIYRVFQGENIRKLSAFLEKEEWRKREAERLNILFEPRGDDSRELY